MRPIAFHAPRYQHRFVRLLKQEMILYKALLGLFVNAIGLGSIGCGATQWIVVTLQIIWQSFQCLHDDSFQLLALIGTDARGQRETTDCASSTNACGQNVLIGNGRVVHEFGAIQIWWWVR